MHLIGLALEQWVREQEISAGDLQDPDTWITMGADQFIGGLLGPVWGPLYLGGKAAVMAAGGPIADTLWGNGYAAATVKNMDDNDKATRVVAVGGEGNAGNDTHSGKANAAYERSKVLSSNDGELDTKTERAFKAKGAYTFKGTHVNVTGSVGVSVPIGDDKGTTMSLGMTVASTGKSALDMLGSLAKGTVRQSVVALAQGTSMDKTVDNAMRIADAYALVFELAAGKAGGGSAVKLEGKYNFTTRKLTIVAKAARGPKIMEKIKSDVSTDVAKITGKFVVGTELFKKSFDFS
jgi:hypothetical protein